MMQAIAKHMIAGHIGILLSYLESELHWLLLDMHHGEKVQ